MKIRKHTLSCVLCTVASLLLSGCKDKEGQIGKTFKNLYVYYDGSSHYNHYRPTTRGDFGDVEIDEYCNEEPHSGDSCIKIEYSARRSRLAGFMIVYWLNPDSNFGSKKEGYNLCGARKLTFWARGKEGKEIISEFKVGGVTGEFPDSDSAGIGLTMLTKTWKEYEINLEGKDLTHIICGFLLSASADDNPSGFVIYLDDINYQVPISTTEVGFASAAASEKDPQPQLPIIAFTPPTVINDGFVFGRTIEDKKEIWKYSSEPNSLDRIASVPNPFPIKTGTPEYSINQLYASDDGDYIVYLSATGVDTYDVRKGKWERLPIPRTSIFPGCFLSGTHTFVYSTIGHDRDGQRIGTLWEHNFDSNESKMLYTSKGFQPTQGVFPVSRVKDADEEYELFFFINEQGTALLLGLDLVALRVKSEYEVCNTPGFLDQWIR